ncbi:MAG TPA: Spy/CpxP family protein refolding chaperone [Thermoanaerobaculia bacterium]|jgi:Spy/CpxP family protein refolding chaperone|nr:Spy/CpxP family protein refolding chaperone [Thermoanaerobaculia bacterium]
MTRQRFIIPLASLILSAGLVAAHAQPPVGGGHGGPPGFGRGPGGGERDGRGPDGPGSRGLMDPRRLADYLQLTDEQRASARQLFEAQRDKVRPLMERQRDLRDQLDEMLDDPDASDAALGNLVKQLHANRRTLEAAHLELEGKLVAMLDAEQKAKFEQLKSVMDGMGFGPGHRHGRRGSR